MGKRVGAFGAGRMRSPWGPGRSGALAPGRARRGDLAAPGFVAVAPDHLTLSDGRVARTLIVRGYPRTVVAGWLAPLEGWPGELRVATFIEPVATATALAELGAHQRAASASVLLTEMRGALPDALDQEAAAEARRLRAALARGQTRLFVVHMALTVLAADLPDLERRCAEVVRLLAGLLVGVRSGLLEQDTGFAATLPSGRLVLSAPRNFDSEALATMYPFSSGGTLPANGEVWGMDRRWRSPVAVDRRALSNPHVLCVAASGAGKSFWAKHILLQAVLRGERVCVLDPHGEYAGWCRVVGGRTIRVDDHTGLGARLLLPLVGEAGEAWRIRWSARLRALLFLLGHRMSPEAAAVCGVALQRAMAGAAPAPTLGGVADELEKEGPAGARMAAVLREALQTCLRGFAGGGGDLPDNLPALVFDLRGVAERTGPGSAAALWLLAEFLLDHWVDPARPPLTVAVDEAHALLAHAVTARFLEELLRSGRKRGAGVLLLTQAIGDLLGAHADPDAARATRAALANAAAVFLMRQQNQREVAMVRALYRLGAEEARLLTTCGRGEGLLVEGRRRASVLVDVPLAMHAAFATDPDGGTPPAP